LGVETTSEEQPIAAGEAAVEGSSAIDVGERVFVEKRPTAVSVIGWAWIVIGGLAALSALSNLQLMFVMRDQDGFFTRWAAGLAFQSLLGGVGLYAGIRFLRLDARARRVLEYLTWILVVATVAWVVGAFIFIIPALEDMLALAPIIAAAAAMYGVPLYFMLKGLRSQRVKDAMLPPNDVHASPSAGT